MSNDFKVSDDMYLVLLKYFNGEMIYLTDEKVKDLSKSEFEGKQIPNVEPKIIKTLKRF